MKDINITKTTWWCKTCKAFTVFNITDNDNPRCHVCENPLESYSIFDVPPDQLHEQHLKYLIYRDSVYNNFISLNEVRKKIRTPCYDNELERLREIETNLIDKLSACKETDASILQFERITHQECTPDNIERIMIMAIRKNTNNNDPCPCGSGKKFKHCHK